jgi:hypothetical protein
MTDIRINRDTGEVAIPDPSGGYRVYRKGDYKLDSANNRVAIPDGGGFVMYDLPKPKAPMFSDPGRSLMLGTRQAIEGLASPLTMVADAANTLANLPIKGANALLGTEIPEFRSASGTLNQALTEGAGFPIERNDSERLGGAIIKGGSGALVTGGASALPALAKSAPGLAAALRINPGSQVVGGMAGGAASEGTRQGLQDTQIFENETADTVAKGFLSLLAGVGAGGAGYLGSRAAVNTAAAGKNAAQGVIDLLTNKGRERIAGQLMREASGDPQSLASRLDDAAAQPPAVPGVRPTTAQALGGDTQLSSLELSMRGDPQRRAAFDARAAENQTARTAALDALSPAGAGSADDLAAGIKQAWAQADSEGQQAIIAAQNRAQERIAALGSNIDQQAAGRIIREELDSALSGARSRTGAAYRAIDPEGTANFAGGEIWQRVAPTIERYFANSTAGTPKELLPIVERLRNSDNLSFAATNAIRKELQGIAGKAAMTGDRQLSAAAGEMADGLASYVDDAAASGRGFSAEQAAQYQAARDLRRDQGQKFERGQVGAVLKKGPYGESRVPDSGVASELFFKGDGSPEAAQQFIAAVGDRPRAVQALQDHIATRLRQAATNADGSVNAGKLMQFQSQHAGALREFPELNARVANLAEAQAAVDQATLAQSARQAEMSGSPLNHFLTKNPTDAVASIIRSNNSEAAMTQAMDQLRGNPASLAAFKRSVVEWIKGQIETAGVQPVSGEPVQSFARLKRIMDTKLATLRKVFGKDEIKALEAAAKQMEQEARVTSAKPMGSNTFSNLASRYLVERSSNSTLPMMGGQSAVTPSLGWLLRGVDNQVRDSINDALLNPSDAARMVRSAQPIPTRDLVQELRQLGQGLASETGIQGMNEQQRAAMLQRGPMAAAQYRGPLGPGLMQRGR